MGSTQLLAQSYYTLTGATGSYTSYNGNYYKESYQLLGLPVYKHASQNFYIYFNNTYGAAWFIDNDFDVCPSRFYKYAESAYPAEGLYEIDNAPYSNQPTLTKISNADITFTNGSSFTPAVNKGSANQVLGRFQLNGDEPGALLTAASIKINGSRSGLSNLKLWESTDAVYNSVSDSQLGATVAADPGDGGSASFSGFSSSIATGGTYYFLTVDVAAEASGILQAVLVANMNLAITGGTLTGTITNAPLSNGDVSLPVELVSFTASVQGNAIVLNWQTATETDNLGFILERAAGNGAWQPIASYRTSEALQGQGSKSTSSSYTWTDAAVTAGMEYRYRLGDVNTDGVVTMHTPISVTTSALPQSTAMFNAYPNPFNPETTINYELHKDTQVTITVYDLLGRQVKTLVDEQQSAGSYHVVWNGTDAVGAQAASGAYLVRMQTAEGIYMQKVLLLK